MSKLCFGESNLFCNEDELVVDGARIKSSAMERRLLLYMMEHENTCVSRDELLREVWGYQSAGISRTVDTHIKTLRAHLGDLRPLISTVRGKGYCLNTNRNRVCLCLCSDKIAC